MRRRASRMAAHLTPWVAVLAGTAAEAQQFNSDNYLSKPAGVATVILTVGQRSGVVRRATPG